MPGVLGAGALRILVSAEDHILAGLAASFADRSERVRRKISRLAAEAVPGVSEELQTRYGDEAEARQDIEEWAVPALVQGWGLTETEIADLRQRLRHHGPETLGDPLADALAKLWPSRPRISPEPGLGTPIHGLVVFGGAS